MKLDVPKVSVVHDVAFLRNPMHITPTIRNFYDRWMPEFIRDADHIITVSEFSKRELISGYNLSPDKVRQHFEITKDNGLTWKTEYDLEYRRKKS